MCKNDKGYFLLELIVALALFFVVLGSFVKIFVDLKHEQVRNDIHFYAFQLASMEMEKLIANPDKASFSENRATATAPVNYEVVASRAAFPQYDMIQVVVSYQLENGKDKKITLSRLVEKQE